MNSGPMIRAEDLRKRYGDRVALDGVSFSVNAGEIVGLLGPNGAGKTTTLSILSGVIDRRLRAAPRSRTHDLATEPRVARRSLGLVPQSLALYPTLTALENLMFWGRIQGMASRDALKRARELLEEVGLDDRADDEVEEFSGGMMRRLNIACGMIHSPAAIMLDEPTVGVDPQSRGRIFAVVERAAQAGGAILYSTHYMEEAERLCNRIVLIDHGKIVAQGTDRELIALAGTEPRIEIIDKKRARARMVQRNRRRHRTAVGGARRVCCGRHVAQPRAGARRDSPRRRSWRRGHRIPRPSPQSAGRVSQTHRPRAARALRNLMIFPRR